jgi:glutathione peroxidase
MYRFVMVMTVCLSLACTQERATPVADPAGGGGTAELDPDQLPTVSEGDVQMTSPFPAPAGVHSFVMKDIDGQDFSLADFRGQVLLVVNVASRCGFTPQYAGLQELHDRYREQRFAVIGVPSNDFGQQEPGTDAQIKEFCTIRYGTEFPMLSKVSVKEGPEQAPLYRYLTDRSLNGILSASVSWNFNKFLIGRDGRVIRHYPSKVAPEDEQLIADIEAALKAAD